MKLFGKKNIADNNPLNEIIALLPRSFCYETEMERVNRVMWNLDRLYRTNPELTLKCLCWIMLSVEFPKKIDESYLVGIHRRIGDILVLKGVRRERIMNIGKGEIEKIYDTLERNGSLEDVKKLF